MLYYLLYPLREYFFAFNVFRYITVRSAISFMVALLFSIIFGSVIIRLLKKFNVEESVEKKDSGALIEMHRTKKGTPTMGGILLIFAILISTLLCADLNNTYVLIIILSTIWLGALGFVDDYIKLKKKGSSGLRKRTKLTGQLILGLIIGLYLYFEPARAAYSTSIGIPFLKNVFLNLGWWYIPFVMLVVVGSSNAVNLTDGLDGLAIGCVIMATIAYGGMSYLVGHAGFSSYLFLTNIPGSGELTVICAGIVGAGLGFLWFNTFPAMVFMGDTGSLTLGGILGIIAVLIKQELLLVIVGGVFVIEAASVIIQTLSFRLKGVRVFKLAPLHHHFEMKGWPEPRVIVRFWILAIIFALLSLATLKIR